MNRRRFLEFSGVAAFSGLALAGCAASPKSGPTATISDWLYFDNTTQQNWYQKNVVDAYNKANPGTKIDLVVKQSASIEQNLDVALSAGHAPDIVFAGGAPHVLAYAQAGYLAEVNDYSSKFDWDKTFQKWAIDSSASSSGKLYGLPTSYESVVIFYNPATFHKHGWSVPKNRSQFEGIMAEAKGKGMLPLAAGESGQPTATGWYTSGLLNAIVGPQAMYEALIGKTSWTDPVFVNAIKQIQGYCDKGWFGGGSQSYATTTLETMYSKLASGEAAMMIMLSSAFAEMTPYFGSAAGNDATYKFAPVPPLGPDAVEDLYILAIGSSVCINKKSANKDKAADFLNWTFDAKRQMEGLAAQNIAPAPVVVTKSEAPATQIGGFYSALSDAKTVGYGSWSSFPPACHTYMNTGMDMVLFDKMTPAAFCTNFDALFKKDRKNGLVPPVAAPGSK